MNNDRKEGRSKRLANGVLQRLDMFSEKFSMNLDSKGKSSNPSIVGCFISLIIIASLTMFTGKRALHALNKDE